MSSIFSPIDGSVLAEIEDTTPEKVAEVIGHASAAAIEWGAASPIVRGRVLQKLGDAMLEREEELTDLEVRNLGAPRASCLAMVRRAAESFRYFGGLCDKISGEVIPVEGDFFTYSKRQPYGVVAAIVPWNAPIIFATKKIAPAIAFGNACVLKPALETPLSALLLAEILRDAGLPSGVAQVIPGGRETGIALTSDPRVDLIVFTGHDATGGAIAGTAARNLVPTALELGGKSAQLVFADAPRNRVIEGLASGIFSNTGQACVAGSRIFVEKDASDDILQRLAERTRQVRVGNPLDPTVEVGPQTTLAQKEKTERMVRDALAAGATLVAEAPIPVEEPIAGGYFVKPTVLTDVTQEMEIAREEVFGPVVIAGVFKTEKEGISLANDTPYGLAAGVWTANVARAHRVADELKAGTVWINTFGVITDRVPFGGIGRSGYGREGGSSSVELYTRPKAVWTSLHDDVVTPELAL